MADVFLANRIRGLNGISRDVAVVLKAVVNYVLSTIIASALVIAVFTKIMVEANAIRQPVLVYEIHKLIHGFYPDNIHVSAYWREHQPIRP